MSAKWAFGILAVCLSISSIGACVTPNILSCARKVTNYILTALALVTWFAVVILILKGPAAKSLITSRVPAALAQYADAAASVLMIPILSFVFAVLMVLIAEIYIHRTYLSS